MALDDSQSLVAIMGDEDMVTGFLLAGIGHTTAKGDNFLVVDAKTPRAQIEAAFLRWTAPTTNIGIILISQQVAEASLRHLLDRHEEAVPAILEIPSKDKPYDPSKDFVMKSIMTKLGISDLDELQEKPDKAED